VATNKIFVLEHPLSPDSTEVLNSTSSNGQSFLENQKTLNSVSEETDSPTDPLHRKRVHFNREKYNYQGHSKFSEQELDAVAEKTSFPKLGGAVDELKSRTRTSSDFSRNRKRWAAFQFLCRQEEVKNWLEKIFQFKVEDLVPSIKDGVLLCELVNRIHPHTIKKINKKNSQPFLLMENIGFFLDACRSLGVFRHTDEPFLPIDLFEEKNIPKVINCLVLLDGAARKLGFQPNIQRVGEHIKFSEQQLKDAEEVLSKVTLLDHSSSKSTIYTGIRRQSLVEVTDDDEERRLKEEQEKKMKEEEERRLKEEQEKKMKEEERRLKEEQEKKMKEEEERRLKEEQEKKMKEEEERRLKEEQEKKMKEELESKRIKEEEEEEMTRSKRVPTVVQHYTASKDDQIDQMLANFLRKHEIKEEDVELPDSIRRVSPGKYVFGNMKVHLRCVNGYLVARVGGGWMKLEEFVVKYGSKAPENQNISVHNTSYTSSVIDAWKYVELQTDHSRMISPMQNHEQSGSKSLSSSRENSPRRRRRPLSPSSVSSTESHLTTTRKAQSRPTTPSGQQVTKLGGNAMNKPFIRSISAVDMRSPENDSTRTVKKVPSSTTTKVADVQSATETNDNLHKVHSPNVLSKAKNFSSTSNLQKQYKKNTDHL